MDFDREKFFAGVKDRIDPTLDQSQVDGINFLLDHFEGDARWSDIRLIAYAFATIFHETAGSFQPVVEGYYLAKTTPPDYAGKTARVKNFQKTLRYYPYFGRGYIQLTWKSGYQKAGAALGLDLVSDPSLALEPETAFKVLTEGLFRAWFGGSLRTYINAKKTDYVGARHCVNGTDKAGLIAGYARSFEKTLKDSAAAPVSGVSDTSEKLVDQTITPAPNDGQPDPSEAPAPPIIKQEADQIINTGDQAAPSPPPQDVTVPAPQPMGSVSTATKVTIGGIVVPPFIVGFIQVVQGWVRDGYLDAKQIGDTVISFIQNNTKYIFMLAGLVIALVIVKKVLKELVFLTTVISHMVPSWNSITVVAPEPVPVTKSWWQFWK